MRIVYFFVLASIAGCSTPDSSLDSSLDSGLSADLREVLMQRSAWDGTPEGAGAVDFLNHGETSFSLLDDDVALDRRAAWYLIKHRDGEDAVFGTEDDDLFASMTEVDSVYWVGPSAIGKIINFASLEGWIPTGNDELGSWDGVTFSVTEAALTVELVNLSSEEVLDDEVPLDKRAVESILAARPLTTVAQLSDLYYVGGSALTNLKEYAVINLGEEPVITEEEEEEEPEPCTPLLTTVYDPAAEGLTTLLAEATTVDAPFAEVLSFDVIGCEDWETNSLNREAMVRALFEQTFVWTWGEISNYVEVSAPSVGGVEFEQALNLSLTVIDEHIADGDWDPTGSSANTELYESAEGWVNDLVSEASANPEAYGELDLYVDLVECSQEAVIRVESASGRVQIVHRFSNC